MNIRGADDFNTGKAPTVDGLSAPDTHTLNIELTEPFAPFLSILAMINAKVVPKEAVGNNFGKSPVGTGPFLFTSWESGKKIILSQNKDYFAGPPALKTVAFHIYSNELWGDIFRDFEKGDLDQTSVPREIYDDVMSNPDYKKNSGSSAHPV